MGRAQTRLRPKARVDISIKITIRKMFFIITIKMLTLSMILLRVDGES